MKKALLLVSEKVAEEQSKCFDSRYKLWIKVQLMEHDFSEISEFQSIRLVKNGSVLKCVKKSSQEKRDEVVEYNINDFKNITIVDKVSKVSLDHPKIIQRSVGRNLVYATRVLESDIVSWFGLDKEDSLFYANLNLIDRIVKIRTSIRTRINETKLFTALKQLLSSDSIVESSNIRFTYQSLHKFFMAIFGFKKFSPNIAMAAIYNMLEKDQCVTYSVCLRDIPTWIVACDFIINDFYRDKDKFIHLTEDDIDTFEKAYIGFHHGTLYDNLSNRLCKFIIKIVSSMISHGIFEKRGYMRLDISDIRRYFPEGYNFNIIEFRASDCKEPVKEFSKVYVLGKSL